MPSLMVEGSFASILAEDGHENPPAFQFYFDQLLPTGVIKGKDVLEVGSGRGLLSLYCALQGAKRVVSLEPEMEGSRSGAIEVQRRRRDQLGLTQLELLAVDFDNASLLPESFDLIIMNAVINHLHETRLPLQRDPTAMLRFTEIASRIRTLLRPGGAAVITDACRYSFWTQARRFNLPRGLCYSRLRTIDWQLHQQPRTWLRVFQRAGFSASEVRYPVPYRLRVFSRLVDSAAVNFCLGGEFILHATVSSKTDRATLDSPLPAIEASRALPNKSN